MNYNITYVEDQSCVSRLIVSSVYKELMFDGELSKYGNGVYFDFHQLAVL